MWCVEKRAVEVMERERWGTEPKCPHCWSFNVRKIVGDNGLRNDRFLWRCNNCNKQFTVRIGTVFEDSRLSLWIWLFAFRRYDIFGTINALEICREYQITYKSALLMKHKILEQKDFSNRLSEAIQKTRNAIERLKFDLAVEEKVLKILKRIK